MPMLRRLSSLSFVAALCILAACDDKDVTPEVPRPGIDVVQIPVVIHVLHNGESIGESYNLSEERILRQIEIINEDYRRKPGTRGFNDDPVGTDTKIEFVLAKQTPEGKPSNGINRIDISGIEVANLGYNVNHFGQYAYWDPKYAVNIWTIPLPGEVMCLILGSATGPLTDLPGADGVWTPGPDDKEGIL